MNYFATRAFVLSGRTVAVGDNLVTTHNFDTRTIGHLLVAGWATGLPTHTHV